MKALFRILFVVAIFGFLLTFGLESSFNSRMQTIQLVKIEPNGGRVLVGSPTPFFPTGDSKFLEEKTGDGVRFLSADRAQNLMPKATFERFFAFARLGCLLAIASSLFGLYSLRIRPWVVDR